MKKSLSILIVDDDVFFTESLSDFLLNQGFNITVAQSGAEGIALFEEHLPPVVLLDQKLPDTGGIEVCRKMIETGPNTKVILMTAYATVPYAVEAMQAGAFDYLSKPFELDELLIAIRMAEKNVRLEGRLRVRDYERQKEKEKNKLIGSSDAMHRIREQMKLAAASEANVLITGETGVGKNVVAQGIHELQSRRENLLTIDCSTIPENLMEAEYFGHEKGVFTGADSRRYGIFELANGGTIILDEIGEIPLHLQSKLLTVLEDKRIRRIGGGRSLPVDVRVIATTNRNLDRDVEERRFRQDLYYRLAVFNMHIPPLRHHPEDIPEIADFFVNRFARDPLIIPDSHMEKMTAYSWPGNVRELRNVIERACLLRREGRIRPADILWSVPSNAAPKGEASATVPVRIAPLEEIVRRHIRDALTACSGNKSRASRLLGISLSTLKRKLKQMDSPASGSKRPI
ncbi:MAG: sigma-54-dependent transcriptional regulator [Thermodesulfobacteriota bacterium]